MLIFFERLFTLHKMCIQLSNVLFDPSDRCTLPIHIFQFVLKLWIS